MRFKLDIVLEVFQLETSRQKLDLGTMMQGILSHYLKEVLGVRSVVFPMQMRPVLWIAIDESLGDKETDLLEKMLKSVNLEMNNFKIVEQQNVDASPVQKQDMVLWFSDHTWGFQEAQITQICSFKHFFEKDGNELKDLKKSTWEKLKLFAHNKI